jgi:hypothetical protein
MRRSALVVALLLAASPAHAQVTVFLDGGGGEIRGGRDDAARDTSSIAYGAVGDGAIDVPAFRGGARRWRALAACVRDRFAEFDLDVVTERPDGAGFTRVMIGGEPSMLGYGEGAGGVAPYTGDVVRGAVAFVFADALGGDVEQLCDATVHEIGHTLGLDHAYRCEDPMSYLHGCGEKRFADVEAACGEEGERRCGDGEDTQNSWQILARNVGLRDDAPAPAPDPTVSIDIADELAGNQWIDVLVHTTGGVDDVDLAWASEDQQFVITCSETPDGLPVACTRDGDTFRFQLNVGLGLRAMVAQARTADRSILSDARVIHLR